MFNNHVLRTRRTLGQKLSDNIAEIGGSWGFILFLTFALLFWVALNLSGLFLFHWDPYPFILLNLFLSCLAAFQAPIILMAQNRAADRDRHKAERDYAVNRKSEREIENVQQDLDEIKQLIREHHKWLKEERAKSKKK